MTGKAETGGIDTPEFRKLAQEWGYATFDPVNIIDEIASRNLWNDLVEHINAAIKRSEDAT